MGAIRSVGGEVVTTIELVSSAGFDGGVVEGVAFTCTVGVLGGTAVAHVTIAEEAVPAHLKTVVHVPVTGSDLVLQPTFSCVGDDVVVVTEGVTLYYAAVGVVEVILKDSSVVLEVAL